MDKSINDFKNKGITILQMPKDQTWLWREAIIEDPDGNKYIIYTAGKIGKIHRGGYKGESISD